jgi:hypothetical protein
MLLTGVTNSMFFSPLSMHWMSITNESSRMSTKLHTLGHYPTPKVCHCLEQIPPKKANNPLGYMLSLATWHHNSSFSGASTWIGFPKQDYYPSHLLVIIVGGHRRLSICKRVSFFPCNTFPCWTQNHDWGTSFPWWTHPSPLMPKIKPFPTIFVSLSGLHRKMNPLFQTT